ncbi:MAG TPA: hypothetical protein VIO61_06140 [Anaerolineaceae bacterium]
MQRINSHPTGWQIWLARFCVSLVLCINLECAFAFLLQPERYAPGFLLEGIPGETLVRGIGLLFVMWNVPYLAALLNLHYRWVSLIEAIWMQTIGLAGESILYIGLPAGYDTLRASGLRFIAFDGAGLLLLLLALWLAVRFKPGKVPGS